MPSDQVILASSAAVIFVAAALYLRSKRNKKMEKRNQPSGYLGWPLIGEVIPFLKPFPVPTLGPFLEHRLSRFGKIFTTNILGKQMVMSADPELNRFVLQNEMRLFQSYWPAHFRKLLGGAHLSLQTGGAHKKLRSIIIGFFSYSRLQADFIRDTNEVARRVVSAWENGSVISAADAVDQYVFSVIAKISLSMKPGESDTEKMREYFETYLDGFFSVPLNLPGTVFSKSLQARDMVQKMVKQMYEERIRAKGSEKSERKDFLEWTMKTPNNLAWKEIGDLVQAVLFGGTETSRQFICLIVHFLEGCPKAVEQLREEHHQAVKDDGLLELTWDNYKKMTFTQCVIDEALRLGPGFLPKKAATDFQFKGYDIPSGSIIFVLYSAVHLDPSLFVEPAAFNPWRWLNKYDIKQTNNLMPFGGGPRLCPGAELARLEITVFLHHFILRYNWNSEEENKPIADPRLKFPNGLRIRLEALSRSI